jgi:hypothetical protein
MRATPRGQFLNFAVSRFNRVTHQWVRLNLKQPAGAG